MARRSDSGRRPTRGIAASKPSIKPLPSHRHSTSRRICFWAAKSVAAMFGKMLVIMDEPTAALGVRETEHVLDLIKRIRDKGLPVILISHDMPAIFEVADRIHIHRLGRRIGVVDPKQVTMSDAVAFITGASEIPSTPTQGPEQ